jgi:hypothetical protein
VFRSAAGRVQPALQRGHLATAGGAGAGRRPLPGSRTRTRGCPQGFHPECGRPSSTVALAPPGTSVSKRKRLPSRRQAEDAVPCGPRWLARALVSPPPASARTEEHRPPAARSRRRRPRGVGSRRRRRALVVEGGHLAGLDGPVGKHAVPALPNHTDRPPHVKSHTRNRGRTPLMQHRARSPHNEACPKQRRNSDRPPTADGCHSWLAPWWPHLRSRHPSPAGSAFSSASWVWSYSFRGVQGDTTPAFSSLSARVC